MSTNYIRKDTCYFSHDSNAKDDPKCVLLIEQLGCEGYGIFWILVETLREQQPDFKYPLILIPALARRYNTTAEKMKTVISSYGLFKIENNEFFFSESLNRRMKIFLDKKKKLSEAGKRGNEKRWKIATQSLGDNKAIAIKRKEIKEKEITLFESNISEEENLLELFPPEDNVNRNWGALKRNLSTIQGSIEEKNKIVRMSNFGKIGHPIWQLFDEIRNSNGKIHTPIAFILSKLN
ncbi:Lin1244/Lin1753 domain-containing protein [Dysgonomonas sp. 25]|uniref:Lin1244/Lin1753 domain-containing protein n=1 Tax=Dysgonomonas sp. 25 TaxID=2302933 RepID=UPI0013CF6CE8|nr:Lin1244/Lin1753 domain-containing protein [Dysgonomonas sp. 25]NDV68935.1 DUF4373 domain-containing protein [Dysgonomonas sp. 25]